MTLKLTSTSTLLMAATTTLVATGLGVYIWKEEHRPPVLEIYIFSLSSGQAMFIRTPEDKRVLVNGGENSEVVRYISRCLPFYSRRIDALIATHTSGKQITGLIGVAERYTIGRAYVPLVTLESLGLASSTDPIFKELLTTVKKNSIPLEHLGADDHLSEFRDLTLKAVFPVSPDEFAYSRASAPEVMFDLVYGKTQVSIYGSASRKIQKHIASSTHYSGDITSRALVVSHNGAADSMSSELIEVLHPDYFIFSQALSYTVPKKTSSKKMGTKTDLELGQRINLKEHSITKITSDGEVLKIDYL
jgi:beta-lactamase superfamily II metal-dependent hydrolase